MYKNLLSLLFWLFLSLINTSVSAAQSDVLGNQIAVSLLNESDQEISQEELNALRSIGITLIEIPGIEPLNHLSFEEFNLLLHNHELYPTAHRLHTRKEQLMQEVLSLYREVKRSYPRNVAAISLFSYPNENDPRFFSAASALADTLFHHISTPLFYHSSQTNQEILPDGFDFITGLVKSESYREFTINLQATYFRPSANTRQSYRVLEHLFNKSVQQPSSIIILPAAWTLENIQRNKGFDRIFRTHMQGETVELPLPDEPSAYPSVNWGVMLLVLIWISFIVHYRNQPGYSAILTRYFTGHSFFVADVMEHRLRSSAPGFIILFQHSLLSGLAFYIVADVFVSDLGLDALSAHFPGILVKGHEYISLFLAGAIIALASHLLSVFWIHILNKQISHISQVLNLYSWPLHLNLILVTLLVYFNQSGADSLWILLTVGGFFTVWFMAFNLAAIDCIRFLEKFKILNFLLTIILHILAVTGLAIWLFKSPAVIEPLRLAFFLS